MKNYLSVYTKMYQMHVTYFLYIHVYVPYHEFLKSRGPLPYWFIWSMPPVFASRNYFHLLKFASGIIYIIQVKSRNNPQNLSLASVNFQYMLKLAGGKSFEIQSLGYFMFFVVCVCFPYLLIVPGLHSFDFRQNLCPLDYSYIFISLILDAFLRNGRKQQLYHLFTLNEENSQYQDI